jgi:hypothetical protein
MHLPLFLASLQGGELLHSTSNSAARHLSQDDQPTRVQHGAKLSDRMATGTPGNRDDPAMTGAETSLPAPHQFRMNGTPTGRGVGPTRVTKPGYYSSRDLEVRPGVGGNFRTSSDETG